MMTTILRPQPRSVYRLLSLSSATSRPLTTLPPRSPHPGASRLPEAETFDDVARPGRYHGVPPYQRELPKMKSRWPAALAALTVAGGCWGLFMTYATNQEKISSSVFRSIMRSVRGDSQVRELLGEAVRPAPEWWLNGDPRIEGRISQLQGNIDVSFRVKGSKGSGTLYFTSIRKEKGVPFTVLRFKIICDDGTVINISDSLPQLEH
ncbi:cytochrome oxidase complex assembly protein 1-domain-containing protein [Coprinopsis sp. MPI-PUGE-AT-0042]|nr:cytochrome oxidase complex assembly protein 1-domain-containing protein [Coprinopsis sp. MPI-PUGE-AT-0042]